MTMITIYEDDDGDQHKREKHEVGDEENSIVLPQTVEGKGVAKHRCKTIGP